MSGILFEDIFNVKDVDPEGKQFDRVSRLFCQSESFLMHMILDVHSWLCPMQLNTKFRLVLAKSLKDNDDDEWLGRVGNPDTQLGPLADSFDYIMRGVFYRFEVTTDDENSHVVAYASFGGLLMRLQGDCGTLQGFDMLTEVYILIKTLAY